MTKNLAQWKIQEWIYWYISIASETLDSLNLKVLTSRVQHPIPRNHSLASSVQSPVSIVQHPTLAYRVQEFRYVFLKTSLKWNSNVELTSADSCRMRGIEVLGTVELVYVGRLLRMNGDSLLVPVWRSFGDGFTNKGELDVWLVTAGTWRPGNLHRSRMGYLPWLISCRLLMAFLPHHRASHMDSIFIHTSHIHFYCISHSTPTSFLFDFLFLFCYWAQTLRHFQPM